jgi:hypothetical protein
VANTCTQIYLHVIFAVEGRQYLIAAKHNDELQKFITGIVSGQKQKLIAINNKYASPAGFGKFRRIPPSQMCGFWLSNKFLVQPFRAWV